jgi:protein dithiol oxidoreductase (disulfide-forming)
MKSVKTLLWAVLFLVVMVFDKQSTAAMAIESAGVVAEVLGKSPTSTGFKEGTDYTLLSKAMVTRDPKKVEVIEFFWYGCPHCFALEPKLEAWAAKLPSHVDFWRSPVVWGPPKEIHAQVYYMAESLGMLDKTHKAFFDAVHAAQEKSKSADVYTTDAELKAFFKTFGVEGDKFDQNFKSFTVISKMKQADARTRGYAIQGVPTLVVNGKYAVQGSMPKALEVVDYLIQKEKK